ncbi:MAG: FAD-binding protein, partial [Myxococcota bacterium]
WVWVDATGARFVDETATWSLVLGGLSTARPNVWGVTTYESLVGRVAVEDQPFLVEGDAFRCAADWDALAGAIAVDAAGLRATLESAAAVTTRAAVDPWGRPPSTLPPLDGGTPCAFRPGRIGAKNFGGLAVDDDGRVYGADGTTVPGLWAVGEAAGMGVPGLGGAWGFDGSLSAVVWSGWRTATAIGAD